jgi:hypothetical protein
MAILSDFIEQHIPAELRYGRDYDGPRGWIHLTNQLLKRLARKGLFDMTLRKETGVEVEDDYWIDLPSDFKDLEAIYYPPLENYTQKDVRYHSEIVNGRIKLYEPFDQADSPDSFTCSGGTKTRITIDDDDAAEDDWKNYLLVPTTPATTAPVLITGNDASAGGTCVLKFAEQKDSYAVTAGYLTDQYLMLVYWATFTGIESEDDEVPIEDSDEDLLTYGLCMMATPASDKANVKLYHDLFGEAVEEKECEVFTPTEDDARPVPRRMPGLENCDWVDDDEYIGDGTDD